MEQISPQCSLKKISPLISQDVGLCGSILKTVNSDFSAPPITLLAILKMAEHACAIHRLLGCHTQDFEWQRIQTVVLEYVGLSEPDFFALKESILELGLGTGKYYG